MAKSSWSGLPVPRLDLIHIVIHSSRGSFHRLFRLERPARVADVSSNGAVASPAYDLACYAIVLTDIHDTIRWMDHQGAITSWRADAEKQEVTHGEDLL